MGTGPIATPREYVVVNLDRKSTLAERVRIAGTSAARRQGLLGIGGLLKGAGLWISPCEAIHTFGMKMPIDAIFLDRHHQVRKLSNDLPPWRISLCLAAASVLEVEAGTAHRTGTTVGDRLSFEASDPGACATSSR
ncbi:MAG: DUF192 domain-containing protein [Acidobacteriaceae bacterium]|nr:DUF192 domain-containing protein [Acidobacteriaceae bacterium]